MGALTYNFPLIFVALTVAAMMGVILEFDRLRGTRLKDWLASFWPPDRRRVLHLSKQNGFYFFVDRLIPLSATVVRLSWFAAIPSIIGGFRSLLVAAFFVSLCFLIRSSCLARLAVRRVKRFSIPIDYDGFGVYSRSADEWRAFGREIRPSLVISSVATCCFLAAAARA